MLLDSAVAWMFSEGLKTLQLDRRFAVIGLAVGTVSMFAGGLGWIAATSRNHKLAALVSYIETRLKNVVLHAFSPDVPFLLFTRLWPFDLQKYGCKRYRFWVFARLRILERH